MKNRSLLLLLGISICSLIFLACPPPPPEPPLPPENIVADDTFYLVFGSSQKNINLYYGNNKLLGPAPREEFHYDVNSQRAELEIYCYNINELLSVDNPISVMYRSGALTKNEVKTVFDVTQFATSVFAKEKSAYDLKVLEQFRNYGFVERYGIVGKEDDLKVYRSFYINIENIISAQLEYPSKTQTKKLVYMVADNDLYNQAIKDIYEMENTFCGCDTYIFLDVLDGAELYKPTIFRLSRRFGVNAFKNYHESGSLPKAENELVSQIVYQFDSAFNSLSKEGMESVFKIVNPNKEPFEMVLFWSHGTDWLPMYTNINNVYTTSSFGVDNSAGGVEMTISDLATIFSDEGSGYSTDLLCFDCCTMGSVEVSSILMDKNIKKVLAPTTQIMEEGFDYSAFMKALTTATSEHPMGKAYHLANAVVDNYKSTHPLGVVAYDMEAFKNLPSLFKDHFTPTSKDFDLIRSNTVKRYDVGVASNKAVLFYDFYSFMEQNGGVPSQIKALFSESSFFVAQKNMDTDKTIKGLSCYIPYYENSSTLMPINDAFKETPWYKESGFKEKFGW